MLCGCKSTSIDSTATFDSTVPIAKEPVPVTTPAFQFVKGYGIVTSEHPVYMLDAAEPPTQIQGERTITLVSAVQQEQRLIANLIISDRTEKTESEQIMWKSRDGATLTGPGISDEDAKPTESQYISDPDFYAEYGYMRYYLAASFELSFIPNVQENPSGYAFQVLDFERPIEFSMKQAPGYETLEALAAAEGSMDTHDGFSVLATGEAVADGILVEWYKYSDSGDRSASLSYIPPMQQGSIPILRAGEKEYPTKKSLLYRDMLELYQLPGETAGRRRTTQLFEVLKEDQGSTFSLTVPGLTFFSREESPEITLSIPEDFEELAEEIPFKEGTVRLQRIRKLTEPQEYQRVDSLGNTITTERPAVYLEVTAVSDTKEIELKRLICQRKAGKNPGERGWENQRYDFDENGNLSGFRIFYDEGDSEVTLKFSQSGFYWSQPYQLQLLLHPSA